MIYIIGAIILIALVVGLISKTFSFIGNHAFTITFIIACIASYSVTSDYSTDLFDVLIYDISLFLLIKLAYIVIADLIFQVNYYNIHDFFCERKILSIIITTAIVFAAEIFGKDLYYGDIFSLLLKLIVVNLALYLFKRYFIGKIRVKKHIKNFVRQIVSGQDRNHTLTEATFFSLSKTQKLISQFDKINGVLTRDFMRDTLKICVLTDLREQFLREISENGDKIYFFYPYFCHEEYLDEQDMDIINIFNSYNVLTDDYCYVRNEFTDDGAFFSRNIYNQIIQRFIPFLKENPTLSDVPFSWGYLFKTMHTQGFLNPFIPEEDLELLAESHDLYWGDFEELYRGVVNEGLEIAIHNETINQIPSQEEDGECCYSLNHADEYGIIHGEYGQSFEANRVTVGDSMSQSQIDELEGCPV